MDPCWIITIMYKKIVMRIGHLESHNAFCSVVFLMDVIMTGCVVLWYFMITHDLTAVYHQKSWMTMHGLVLLWVLPLQSIFSAI